MTRSRPDVGDRVGDGPRVVATIDRAADQIVALVAHARDVPAPARERFAHGLGRRSGDRALIVETCHRVDAYLVTPEDPSAVAVAASLPAGGRILRGVAAVRHAVTVATGRDSVVVGEDQIVHQLRSAVDAARAAGALDPVLERLFAIALQAGRQARSWHTGRPRSLADVAVETIERRAGPVRDRPVLVVGAGEMGALAVRAARAAGATVDVASRSEERACALAASSGSAPIAFDPGPASGPYVGVIVALAGPWPVATATLDTLAAAGSIVVDLSMPASLGGGAAERLGDRLVGADDLARREDAGPVDARSRARVEALIDRAVADFVEWQKRRNGRAAARALIDRADREREAELQTLWRQLPHLDPATRDAIEGMTRHLASRLLRQPLERLGRDADGRDSETVRELFAL